MKKHSRSFLSPIAALLVLAAITPNSVWAAKCSPHNRKPASSEEINCLKEEKDKLENDMKKLVEDKQSILKELDELKSKKKDSVEIKEAKKEDKKEDKKKEDKKADNEIVDVMFQMTSMMISQQQQQTLMMNQMFSMMNQQMQRFAYPKADSWSDYVSPYSFNHNSLNAGYNPYSLESLGKGIGLSASYANPYRDHESHYIKTPYRYPAEQPAQLHQQPLIMQPRIDGFDFGSPMDIPPVPQDKAPVQMVQQKILRT